MSLKLIYLGRPHLPHPTAETTGKKCKNIEHVSIKYLFCMDGNQNSVSEYRNTGTKYIVEPPEWKEAQ